MKMLELTQEQRHYNYEGGTVSLRILYPSKPYGVWQGNPVTIREWHMNEKGQAMSRPCTREEILSFETALGELLVVGFTTHPTLGLVAIEGM